MRVLGLIISTGRCGTRSIAEFLDAFGRQDLRVYHERLTVADANPRGYFRAYDRALLDAQARQPAVRALLDDLDGTDDATCYIETGWTVYPLVPLLIDRYPGKVRVLHLTRHPVPTAASLTLHGLYEDGRERELGIPPVPHLLPDSPRVFHPEVAADWSRMSLFERNLFRVTEINLLGLELERRFPDVPSLRLKLESFDDRTPGRIVELFGLGDLPAGQVIPRSNVTARLARGARSVGEEWRRVFDLPWAVEAAERIGYPITRDDAPALERRLRRYRRQGPLERMAGWVYRIGPTRRIWRRLRAAETSTRVRD